MKCAHPGCKCNVAPNSTYGQYCSEHCKNAGDQRESHCTCNHPDCR